MVIEKSPVDSFSPVGDFTRYGLLSVVWGTIPSRKHGGAIICGSDPGTKTTARLRASILGTA